MSRKKSDQPPVLGVRQEIIDTPMEEVMHDSMIPYAEYVILERALPRVEDGLKPVQRRILFTMHELGMTPDKPHRKCARIVGDCLGKYHPHGDTSVYDAMVRMAQPFAMRGMLVDGHGNFGSIDGDSAAAMRYTEARMAPLALEMLRDIDKETVPHRLNFDDTLKEPDMLPARYPNLLVNGASGIAVGLATNIPPHNLGEVTNAVIAQMKNPDITTKELMKIVPAPDFPTGGLLVKNGELENAYETGRGKLQLRAKVEIEHGRAGRTLLVITEMPYQVNKAAMLEKILRLSEEKKAQLGGIHDIRDESDRTGMRAVIELKKDVDPQKVLAVLYKYSDLQVSFGVNMVAIANGKPEQLSLKATLAYYIQHQKNVVTARTKYELEEAKARKHILQGLMVAVDNLDEVLRLIRASKNGKEAKEKLVTNFPLDEIQAQAILDLRLQRLTGLEIEALRKQYDEIVKLIGKLEAILGSEAKLEAVIQEELLDIARRHGDYRRTQLIADDTGELPDLEETIEAQEAVVVFTRGGALRRLWPKVYEKMPAPEEEKDLPEWELRTWSNHTLYFFTDLGNCYALPVASVPEANRPKDRGLLLTGLLAGWEDGEQVIQLFDSLPSELPAWGELLFFTKRGMVKRTVASEYMVRKGKYIAMTLKGTDRVLSVRKLQPELDILMISKYGMSIHFSQETVPVTGRATGGVHGMQLDLTDELAFAFQMNEEGELVVISERGYAKRVLMVDFDIQNRNGKGLKAFTFNKNGSNGTMVAGAVYVKEPVELEAVQAMGGTAPLHSDVVMIEPRASKGRPYIIALMDDVVVQLRVRSASEAAPAPEVE